MYESCEQPAAFKKVMKVIESCKTLDQVCSARRMVDLYLLRFGNNCVFGIYDKDVLHKKCDSKIDDININGVFKGVKIFGTDLDLYPQKNN